MASIDTSGTLGRKPGDLVSEGVPPSARFDHSHETGAADHQPGITRPRLTDRLLCSPPAALVLLSAPAGYSKTTTLRSWAVADRRPFLWISCDRRHDDPAYLITEIAEAAGQLTAVEDAEVAALAIEASWPERALLRLSGMLGEIEVGFALVLDDAHLLRSEGSTELLRGLVEVLPPQAQLVIGTRETPPVPLGRMRANRNLLEFGHSDLAMTKREGQRLLKAAGLDLDDHQLDSIHERTEGWPAALYLASLSLSGQSDMDRAVETFTGDDRDVAEYLRDEFLSSTDRAKLEFMTRTSVLETLNGPLCDFVLERSGSASLLRELAGSNALVIPLDRTDDSYRYHHLFADMLHSELMRSEPLIEKELHARASRWFEKNSMVEPAVEHAIASPVIQSLARAQLALISTTGGDREAATLLVSEARLQVDSCGLARYPALVLVYSIEAMVWAAEGREGRAKQCLNEGLDLLGRLNSFPAWYEVETRLGLAEASIRLGDPTGAEELLSQARIHLKLTDDAVVLREWLESIEARLVAEETVSEAPPTTLTKAEMQTLSYLPTHLSFRQIGEARGVSANTVKTQARSVYRKLGASTRAEAVDRAQLAGLLEVDPPEPGNPVPESRGDRGR